MAGKEIKDFEDPGDHQAFPGLLGEAPGNMGSTSTRDRTPVTGDALVGIGEQAEGDLKKKSRLSGSRLLLELASNLGPKFAFTPEKLSGNLRSKYGRLQKVNEAVLDGSFPIEVRGVRKSSSPNCKTLVEVIPAPSSPTTSPGLYDAIVHHQQISEIAEDNRPDKDKSDQSRSSENPKGTMPAVHRRRISLRRLSIGSSLPTMVSKLKSTTVAVAKPSKMVELNGTRISPDILQQEKYRPITSLLPGKLIWGVLAKFPYWPCMVCCDPNGLYLRQVEGKHIILQTHVRFFGPKGLRSWISPTSYLDFEPDNITDSLRNGLMGKKAASEKILAELTWAIEDAQIVAFEKDLERRPLVFQAIIEEQFARWKEDRRVTASTVGAVKRRRSSLLSNQSNGQAEKKRIRLSTGMLDGDASSQSFRSSSGVSTMSKSSLDTLSISSAGLDIDEEVHTKVSKGPVLKSRETVEEELAQILKAVPSDLSEFKKIAQMLCRQCTRDGTCGSLVQCAGPCGGTYHEACLDLMAISMERLMDSRKYNVAKSGSKKPGKKLSTGADRCSDNISERALAEAHVPMIAHVTGDTNLTEMPVRVFKCRPCRTGELPDCFICHKPTEGRLTNTMDVAVARNVHCCCTVPNCGRVFHLDCLGIWPQAKRRQEDFICPQHQCHLCISVDPRSQNLKIKQKLFRCLLCPAAYHLKECCLPAGTEIVGAEAIICQRHFALLPEAEPNSKPGEGDRSNDEARPSKYKRKPMHFSLNVNWCFICARGGNLICCDQCPSAFHRECLRLEPVISEDEAKVEKFICEECELGRFPLYGELVWAKFSNYRWWPGVIVSDSQVPAKLNWNRRNRGEFCIKFLGSNDYAWIGRRRVFLYHDDDSLLVLDEKGKKGVKVGSSGREDMIENGRRAGDLGSCGRSGSYEASFQRSLWEARVMNEMLRTRKAAREMELCKLLRPLPYLKLKVNRAVPPVKLVDFRSENMEDSTCNCRKENEESVACGSNSECLNRLLLTECNPSRCPAGKQCDNQQLQRRQYPPLDIIRTLGKGWGLIAKKELKAGDLVCEYVGELINNAEMRRRIKEKEAEKDDVYYFLTLNNNLIIDAERKGNLARFMNHSCEPNCESQKWTVNGNTRVGLFAIETIPANTELTFNYNWESTGTNRTACQCGAKKCKGFIGSGSKKI